ncbi:MAG: protein kinase, partial [Vicinamibacterales bacterium]
MIGRTISHYKILSSLGAGGMGVVYEAEDTRLGRRVALKLLSDEACCDQASMERFLREARIVSSLNHPHICTLHDIGEADGQQFMVMELLDGESLKARIARGPLRFEDVLDLGAQIADALDAAHAQGVVHRDIKPANLFVTRRGLAKVLDFGVAKLGEAGRGGDTDVTVAGDELTTTGSAIGTVAYMSPEQARGEEIDARSDLFSLGIVLYEMATGRQPFPGATPAVIFEGILTRTPPPPSTLNADVPPAFDQIVLKALEKDRETRYQSAADLRADLKRLKRETDSGRTAAAPRAAHAAAPLDPVLRRRRALYVGAPAVTLAIVAAVFAWYTTRTPALSERDTVVLTDFVNRTGDQMFDDTLAEALAVQLRQSPFLNLLSDTEIESQLRLMGRDPMSRLTPDIAAELCQRAGAKATLGGTISSLGSSYVLTLSARDCVTSGVLAEAQAQAAGKEQVLTALGDATKAFREQLGESLASLQRYDAKIEEATTSSLEALKAYSQAVLTRRTEGDFASIPFFKRAIELDPDFALAYARLGTVYSNLGQMPEAQENTQKAYGLRERVSERERFYIIARYHTTVDKDIDQAVETYRLWKAAYPSDYTPYVNLGLLLRQKGDIDEALTTLEEAARLAPQEPLAHLNLGQLYVDRRRFDDARKQFEETLALQESTSARVGLATIGILTRDDVLVDSQVAAVRGRRDDADLLGTLAGGSMYWGRMKRADEQLEALAARMEETGRIGAAGEGLLNAAIAFASVGLGDRARAYLALARQKTDMPPETVDEQMILGMFLRDPSLVQPALDQAAKAAPADKPAIPERLLRAVSAAAAGQSEAALEALGPVSLDFSQVDTVLLQAWIAIDAGHYDEAVTPMEWLLANDRRVDLSPTPGLERLMLAKAYAGAGRIPEARKAYEAFFEFWRDADTDLPVMVAARQAYEQL